MHSAKISRRIGSASRVIEPYSFPSSPLSPLSHLARPRLSSSFSLFIMVSARPPPAPARGRIAYPSATAYTPGDVAHSPAYLKGSEPVQPITSRDSDAERAQGLKTWWKTFRERPEGSSDPGRGVFGVPLAESIDYASVQISTAGQDGALYVWG